MSLRTPWRRLWGRCWAHWSPKKPKVPEQLEPSDGQQFSHYPPAVTLKWKRASKAKDYAVEIDCFQCRTQGKWDSGLGQPWRVSGIKNTHYDLTFVDRAQGRWRVWGVGDTRKSAWTPWSHFSFGVVSSHPSQQPGYGALGGDSEAAGEQPGHGQEGYGAPQGNYPAQSSFPNWGTIRARAVTKHRGSRGRLWLTRWLRSGGLRRSAEWSPTARHIPATKWLSERRQLSRAGDISTARRLFRIPAPRVSEVRRIFSTRSFASGTDLGM